MASNSPTSTGSGRHAPVMYLILGVVGAMLALICIVTQIQTTEAFFSGSSSVAVFKPDWMVFAQVPGIFTGQYVNPNDLGPDIAAYVIEVFFLAAAIAWDVVTSSAHKSGKVVGGIALIVILGCIIFNVVTDFNFGSIGGGWQGHLVFALAVCLGSTILPTVSIALIMHSWRKA